MTATTDRDKAENLWQLANSLLIIAECKNALSKETIDEACSTLKENRLSSKETQTEPIQAEL